MKTPIAALAASIFIATPVIALAQDGPSRSLEDMYFDGAKNPTLTPDEKTAVTKWAAWNRTAAVTPFMGRGGEVQFEFGTQEPSIICAVMQVCDIALQAGEQINSMNVGDSARWNVDPAVTGAGNEEVQHLIIKPLDVGLNTSLVVATNRRTYHIQLHSHRTTFMPAVSFSYPEDAIKRMEAFVKSQQKERADRTITSTGEYLGNLDFKYKIRGDAPFKPTRVYNDGRKTIIELPDSVMQSEAPTLLVQSPFSSSPGLVNSRLQNNRFIVDQLFDRAILVVGVGPDKQKVTIIRDGS